MPSEYYRERFRWPDGLLAFGFVICWGLAFGSAVLFAPGGLGLVFGLLGWGAAALSLFGLWRQVRDNRRGVQVDDQGLTEWFWFRRPRRLPWAAVQDVRVRDARAEVVTAAGDLRFDAAISGWRRLARRCEAAVLEVSEADLATGPQVAAAEVADWLGLEPDGVLHCRGTGGSLGWLGGLAAWGGITLALTLFYAGFLAGALRQHGALRLGLLLFTLAHASIFFAVFSGLPLVNVLRRMRASLAPRVVADATGLHVRGPLGAQFHPWSEIEGVDRTADGWRITTRDDSFTLPAQGTNVGRLVNAVQRAAAARQAGRPLPAGEAIPAGALSVADDEPTRRQTERGLSLTADANLEEQDA